MYIDMEGRSDDQSMQIMLEQMAPRRIAFVHGNTESASNLANRLQSKSNQIYLTKISETIEMKSDTKTYSIKMDDTLLHGLKMKKVDDYEIARFSGIMKYPEDETEGEEGQDNSKKKEEKRMLLFPNNSLKEEEGKDIVLIDGNEIQEQEENKDDEEDEGMWMGVGELKLSEIRIKLQRLGIRADFQQGYVFFSFLGADFIFCFPGFFIFLILLFFFFFFRKKYFLVVF